MHGRTSGAGQGSSAEGHRNESAGAGEDPGGRRRSCGRWRETDGRQIRRHGGWPRHPLGVIASLPNVRTLGSGEGLRPLDPRTEIRRAAPVQTPRSLRPSPGRARAGHDGPAVRDHEAAGERCHPAVQLVNRVGDDYTAHGQDHDGATEVVGDEPMHFRERRPGARHGKGFEGGRSSPSPDAQCGIAWAGSCHLHDRSQLFPSAVPVVRELVVSDPVSASRSSSADPFPS